MSELKLCPFCGGEAQVNTWTMHGITESRCFCPNSDCPNSVRTVALEQWNARPIEDALRAEIARLQEKLHDEMSQLEIATDLGNKRWVALNDIYENGEKHNANWCKRKAQKGLGIK